MVEVVLAIGIVAFAFVPLFALIPVGMTTFRQSIDTIVTTQVVQRVINEEQETDFSVLINPSNALTTRYFDNQGDEVTTLGASLYVVQITVTPQTSLPNAPTASSNLATLVIKCAVNPGRSATPFSVTSNSYSTYSQLIAKN